MLSNTEQHKIFIITMQELLERNSEMMEGMEKGLWSTDEGEFIVASFFLMNTMLVQFQMLKSIAEGMIITRCEYTRLRKQFIEIMTENLQCDDNIRIH